MLATTSQPAVFLGTPGTNGRTSAVSNRLTRKESQLLAALQQNPGRCLSRGYLLETIWGYRDGTKTRTLDVHVQRLRRKLGPDHAWHILTVLRSGYSWQEVMPAAIRQDVH
jgi:DNA-binding response OmpR family regulator